MVCTERKFISAIIVTLSLFVALGGIVGSSYAKISKNKFSPPRVVEIRGIETEGSASKIGQFVAEFFSPFFSFAPTEFYVAIYRFEARSNPFSLTTLIPARAPPSIS